MDDRSTLIAFRTDANTARLIKASATQKGKTQSDLIRELIERGLKADGYKNDDDRLYGMIKSALKELLDPAVNRLAAISAKNAQMAGADYVMLIYLARLLLEDGGDMTQVDEMSEQARKSGIEILKAKDTYIDSVIKKAVAETKEYI